MDELHVPSSFEFPFVPYGIQLDFMKQLYETIEAGKIGIFESPTGTGKSLSIICAGLKWLKDHRNRTSLLNQVGPDTNTSSKDNQEVDWIKEWKDNNDAKIRQETVIKSQKYRKKRKRETDDVNTEIRKLMKLAKDPNAAESKEDVEFMLEDYDSDNQDNEGQVEYIDKIYYASRTHSQLSQFVKEIKNSPFKSSITVSPIASRRSLCVNSKIKQLSTITQMNEACRQLNQKSGCEFKTKKGLQLISTRLNNDLMDIEDLVKFGSDNKCCPFYGSREALPTIDVCVMPYNLLIVPSARESCGINLKNSVVIIDEAHNLSSAIESAYSIAITSSTLQAAYRQLNQYKSKYGARLNAKNLMFVKQLLQLIMGFAKELKKAAKEKTGNVQTVRELIQSARLEQIDLFALVNYMAKSLIANKVKGFHEKEASSSKPAIEVINPLKKLLHANKRSNKQEIIEEPEQKPRSVHQFGLAALVQVEMFLSVLITPGADLRVIHHRREDKAELKIFLLNPATIFSDLSKDARSVILAGGTMKPYQTLKDQLLVELSPNRISWFNCNHVIDDNQMNAIIVKKGPTGKLLEFNHKHKDDVEMKLDLGRSLVNITAIVPSGIVVFFTSYKQEQQFHELFAKNKILEQIESKKTLFREPKEASDVGQLLNQYQMAVRNRGAILFAVVGGKVSEGINFSNELCRAVIMVGLPYPDIKSVEIELKMNWLNKKRPGAGQMLYQGLCMRAVNQCVGRSIRHRNDSSLILFFDNRYCHSNVLQQLPDWIKKRCTTYNDFKDAHKHIAQFCKQYKELT